MAGRYGARAPIASPSTELFSHGPDFEQVGRRTRHPTAPLDLAFKPGHAGPGTEFKFKPGTIDRTGASFRHQMKAGAGFVDLAALVCSTLLEYTSTGYRAPPKHGAARRSSNFNLVAAKCHSWHEPDAVTGQTSDHRGWWRDHLVAGLVTGGATRNRSGSWSSPA